jgi:hypothetical protein
MERTYRLSRSCRDTGLLLCGMAVLMESLVAVAAIQGPGGPRAGGRLLCAAVFLLLFFFGLSLFALWCRAKMIVAGSRVTVRGLLASHTIELADVVAARWDAYGRSLIIKTATTRARLGLFQYDPPAAGELIRFFRKSLPAEIQEDWGFFYRRIIVSRWRKDQTPQAGEILITRRRYDRYAFWTLLLLLGLAVAAAHEFRGVVPWYYWAALPALASFWVALRYSIPRSGMVHRPMRRSRRTLAMFLVALVAPLAMFPVMAFWPEFFKRHEVLLSVVMLCWAIPAIAADLVFLHRDERRERDEANLAARDLPKIPPELLDD